MDSISYKLVVFWHKPDKKGRCPIMIRVICNRKSTYRKTGYKVRKDEWDESGRFKPSVPNSLITNSNISKKLSDIQRLFAVKELNGEPVSSKLLKKENELSLSFFSLASEYVLLNTGKFKDTYIKHLETESSKLKQFVADLNTKDINVSFLEKYEAWMIKRGNSVNTIWKSMKFIKTVLNMAIKKHGLKSYPFHDYKAKYQQTLRNHLTISEIEKIEEYIDSENVHKSLFAVGAYFILSCYSGLRYSDLVSFSEEKSIRDGRLLLSTSKTGEIVSILITDKIKKALVRVHGKKLVVNQRCNMYLKIISEIIGINKNLTFHMARHSFAVNAASLGIPIEVVSVLLGHRNIKTTAIYYKISNPKIDSEMAKWNLKPSRVS